MRTALALVAATAISTFAVDAHAQTRARAQVGVAVQAPLPAVPYRLIGPGAVQADVGAEARVATPEVAATTPPEPRAAPQAAAPETAATSQAAPAVEAQAGVQVEADVEAEAGPETPERARAQAALTRVLGGLAAGTPDYEMMNAETAARVRAQQPTLTPALRQYGAVRTITPLAEANGTQRFRVDFENGAATFVVNADAEGTITALGVE